MPLSAWLALQCGLLLTSYPEMLISVCCFSITANTTAIDDVAPLLSKDGKAWH